MKRIILLAGAIFLLAALTARPAAGAEGGGHVVPRIPWGPAGMPEKPEETAGPESEPAAEEAETGVLVRTNPRRYRWLHEITIKTKDIWKDSHGVVLYLPYPETNEYQTVEHEEKLPGRVQTMPGFGTDKCLRIYYSADRIAAMRAGMELTSDTEAEEPVRKRSVPEEITIRYAYTVTLTDFAADFDRIPQLFSYDTDSEIFREYTRAEGQYIDPENAEIFQLADAFRSESENDLEFILRAFRHAKDEIHRLEGRPSLQPLAQTLRKGGQGNSINAVFVSLLRAGGIPARMVMARRTDKAVRVWSEFYLEKYGWIPADPGVRVTSDRFFGRVALPRQESRSTREVPQELVVNHLYGEFGLPVPGGQDIPSEGLLDCKFWGLYTAPRYRLTITELTAREEEGDKSLAPLKRLNFRLRE